MPTHDLGPGLRDVIRLTRDGSVRGLAAPGTPTEAATGTPRDAALEELRLRYARGEMAREDYTDRLQDLSGGALGSARSPTIAGGSGPTPPDGP